MVRYWISDVEIIRRVKSGASIGFLKAEVDPRQKACHQKFSATITMPRRFIDKKKATTFHLVHRSQRDPLINDPESSSRVLKYVPPSNSKSQQTITRESLEEDIDIKTRRSNKGEAAEYGIYFDDTEYDYMQHLRCVGEAPDAVLLEAPSKSKDNWKGKAKEMVFGEKVLNTAMAGVLLIWVAWHPKGSSCV